MKIFVALHKMALFFPIYFHQQRREGDTEATRRKIKEQNISCRRVVQSIEVAAIYIEKKIKIKIKSGTRIEGLQVLNCSFTQTLNIFGS